jgi:hypothetical protein
LSITAATTTTKKKENRPNDEETNMSSWKVVLLCVEFEVHSVRMQIELTYFLFFHENMLYICSAHVNMQKQISVLKLAPV